MCGEVVGGFRFAGFAPLYIMSYNVESSGLATVGFKFMISWREETLRNHWRTYPKSSVIRWMLFFLMHPACAVAPDAHSFEDCRCQ